MTWLLALSTLTTFAAPPTDPAMEMGDRLVEKLGVTQDVANDMVALITDHRDVAREQREVIKDTAKALREARTTGDVGEMKRLIKELRKHYDRGRQIQEQHTDEILALLTVDQQAQWLLFSLNRQHKRRTSGLPQNPR